MAGLWEAVGCPAVALLPQGLVAPGHYHGVLGPGQSEGVPGKLSKNIQGCWCPQGHDSLPVHVQPLIMNEIKCGFSMVLKQETDSEVF